MQSHDEQRARKAQRATDKAALPLNRPLDDGPRDGTEIWRVVEGVELCHWDRWLLRLSLAETGGLDALAVQFKQRRDGGGHWGSRTKGEALLLQTEDLQRRLVALKKTPSGVLDPIERYSEWLLKKAHKRVFHDGPTKHTAVMLATPRKVLCARAMRGHWDRFPISPAPFALALERATDARSYDYRNIDEFVSAVERGVLLLVIGADSAQRLAVHRAALTVVVEAMDRIDDSDADVAVMFRVIERAYHDDLCGFAAVDGLMRDFLEFAIWEDYGLMDEVPAFLQRLPVEHAESAQTELVDMIAELEREELEYHAEKARELAAALRP